MGRILSEADKKAFDEFIMRLDQTLQWLEMAAEKIGAKISILREGRGKRGKVLELLVRMIKEDFLQQNAFDEVDRYSTAEKQLKMLQIILTYYQRGAEAIKRGVTLVRLRRMKVYQELVRMKITIGNDEPQKLDKLEVRLERSFDQLESIYV